MFVNLHSFRARFLAQPRGPTTGLDAVVPVYRAGISMVAMESSGTRKRQAHATAAEVADDSDSEDDVDFVGGIGGIGSIGSSSSSSNGSGNPPPSDEPMNTIAWRPSNRLPWRRLCAL